MKNILFLLIFISTVTFASFASADIPGLRLNSQALNVQVDPSSGSANLPIHIDVPPGRGGIEPNISLVYSSGNHQLGLAGVGWSFDLGSVMVSTKKGVPHYDSSDIYMLSSGANLIYDASVGYYRTEVEGGFSKIEKTSNGWLITDKKGTKYFYGSGDESRQFDPNNTSHVFRWCLNKVIDVFGNAMNIYYFKDGNQVYPDHINYTQVEGVNATFVNGFSSVVTFSYRDTYQPSTSYQTGFQVTNNRLVTKIIAYQYDTCLECSGEHIDFFTAPIHLVFCIV